MAVSPTEIGILWAGVTGYSEVVFLILLYKSWNAIQDGHARTGPGEAVLWFFVPLMPLYWFFPAYAGFVSDYNAFLCRHKLDVPALRPGLFRAAAVLGALSAIPLAGLAMMPAFLIVQAILTRRLSSALNALPQGYERAMYAERLRREKWSYSQRWTRPLLDAASRGDTARVEGLLFRGQDMNAAGQNGLTALMAAAYSGHRQTVQCLLARGADVNRRLENGGTALMLAAMRGHAGIVRDLISYGADLDLTNQDGRTAGALAEAAGHQEAARALKESAQTETRGSG